MIFDSKIDSEKQKTDSFTKSLQGRLFVRISAWRSSLTEILLIDYNAHRARALWHILEKVFYIVHAYFSRKQFGVN